MSLLFFQVITLIMLVTPTAVAYDEAVCGEMDPYYNGNKEIYTRGFCPADPNQLIESSDAAEALKAGYDESECFKMSPCKDLYADLKGEVYKDSSNFQNVFELMTYYDKEAGEEEEQHPARPKDLYAQSNEKEGDDGCGEKPGCSYWYPTITLGHQAAFCYPEEMKNSISNWDSWPDKVLDFQSLVYSYCLTKITREKFVQAFKTVGDPDLFPAQLVNRQFGDRGSGRFNVPPEIVSKTLQEVRKQQPQLNRVERHLFAQQILHQQIFLREEQQQQQAWEQRQQQMLAKMRKMDAQENRATRGAMRAMGNFDKNNIQTHGGLSSIAPNVWPNVAQQVRDALSSNPNIKETINVPVKQRDSKKMKMRRRVKDQLSKKNDSRGARESRRGAKLTEDVANILAKSVCQETANTANQEVSEVEEAANTANPEVNDVQASLDKLHVQIGHTHNLKRKQELQKEYHDLQHANHHATSQKIVIHHGMATGNVISSDTENMREHQYQKQHCVEQERHHRAAQAHYLVQEHNMDPLDAAYAVELGTWVKQQPKNMAIKALEEVAMAEIPGHAAYEVAEAAVAVAQGLMELDAAFHAYRAEQSSGAAGAETIRCEPGESSQPADGVGTLNKLCKISKIDSGVKDMAGFAHVKTIAKLAKLVVHLDKAASATAVHSARYAKDGNGRITEDSKAAYLANLKATHPSLFGTEK